MLGVLVWAHMGRIICPLTNHGITHTGTPRQQVVMHCSHTISRWGGGGGGGGGRRYALQSRKRVGGSLQKWVSKSYRPSLFEVHAS